MAVRKRERGREGAAVRGVVASGVGDGVRGCVQRYVRGLGDAARGAGRLASLRLLALLAALCLVPQAPLAHGAEAAAGDASRMRLGQRLVDAAGESIAAFAAAGLRMGDPDGGAVLSPTFAIDPALEEALDRGTALELLLAELPRPDRMLWRALSEPLAARPSGTEAPAAVGAAGFHPSAESDLERVARLLVVEALLARVGGDTRLPADAVRDMLAALPRPAMHPGADGGLLGRVRTLERGGGSSAAARTAAQRLAADFESAMRQIEPWRERHEAVVDRIASLADGEDGRALAAVTLRVMAAQSGWPPPPPRTPSGRISTAARQADPVARSIRQSVRDGCGGHALAEALVALRPLRVARVDSMVVGPDGRLRVGRSEALLSEESIDDWRRAAGLVRTAVGWTGMPERPRPRAPRIRDAPLGFKPL